MRLRAVARLAVVSGAAIGVLALAHHLESDVPSAPTSGPVTALAGQAAGSAASLPDAQSRLEGAVAPATRTGPTAAPGAAGAATVVDESLPHTHVVDPETGGLISVAGAVGTVPAADRLGPMHADPMPPGVSLSDPVDTRALLQRAGVRQASGATTDAQPAPTATTAAADVPPGDPGVSSLTAHVAPSCTGSGTDGKRVQVLYAHEASTASRYTEVLPVLRDEVANVDDVFAVSSKQTGGGRRVRWVHDDACLPVIKDVTVPDGALGSDFWGTINALKKLGYNEPSRKYLVFADANRMCGIGTLYNDLRRSSNYNDGYAASFARIDANCWSTGHSVAAHELTHNFGGVQQGAPHATVNGHCWDEADIMCYNDGSGVAMKQVCGSSQEQLLDCNKDDYFNTNPAPGTFLAMNWNAAGSSFLDVVPVLGSSRVVDVRGSTAAAETGDTVTFTGSSSTPSTWTWATTAACTLTSGAAGTADLLCPATVTGTVSVTGTATDTATGAVATATASVAMSKAAAPTVAVSAPTSALAGQAFAVRVAATGKGALSFAWSAGTCSVQDASTAATTVTCPAGTPVDHLPVTATVTQADGQTGRASAYVDVAAGATPSAARLVTSWTTTRATTRGVSSQLLSGGAPVVGAPSRVQVWWYRTQEWVDLGNAVTDGNGVASAPSTYSRAGWFRFVFDGDGTRSGSASREVFVKVATTVAPRAARHRVAATLQTGTGARMGGTTLTLQRRAVGSARWLTVARARTDASGTVVMRVSPPRRSYYRWVYAGDTTHLRALSPRVTVRR
jgi:hypothetical protein